MSAFRRRTADIFDTLEIVDEINFSAAEANEDDLLLTMADEFSWRAEDVVEHRHEKNLEDALFDVRELDNKADPPAIDVVDNQDTTVDAEDTEEPYDIVPGMCINARVSLTMKNWYNCEVKSVRKNDVTVLWSVHQSGTANQSHEV